MPHVATRSGAATGSRGTLIGCAIVVPLRARGHALGTILLGHVRPEAACDIRRPRARRDLAGRAAIAIDNARLYRDVQENNRRKNEFLAMLAHELRNPLAPIRNAVEILQMLDLHDPNLHWANDVISRQVEHMVRLVDDLLDISRITGGKIQLRKEPIDVAAAVDPRRRDQPAADRRPQAPADRQPALEPRLGSTPTWSGSPRCSPTC